MVQEELIRHIADENGMKPTQVKAVLESLGYCIGELKPGDEIRTTLIGTFSVSHKDGRMGRNPRTGAAVEIDPVNVAKFKPAKHIRDALNA
jgi:nucleoid DNA-binding protein